MALSGTDRVCSTRDKDVELWRQSVYDWASGCKTWSINRAVGLNTELHWEIIGRTGGT